MVKLRLGNINNKELKFIPTKMSFLEDYLNEIKYQEEYELTQTYKDKWKYRRYNDNGIKKYTRNHKKQDITYVEEITEEDFKTVLNDNKKYIRKIRKYYLDGDFEIDVDYFKEPIKMIMVEVSSETRKLEEYTPPKGFIEVTSIKGYDNKDIYNGSIKKTNIILEGTDGVGKSYTSEQLLKYGIITEDREMDTFSNNMVFEISLEDRAKLYNEYLKKNNNIVIFMVNNDDKELEERVLSRKNISEFDMECVKYNNLYLKTYNYMKDKKLTEIILSDFKCDKACPYCTAKITKWDRVDDDIYTLSMYVEQLKRKKVKFKYVTIGGNGEPTLHSYEKLKEIVELFDDYDIPIKRVLTSGNVFRKEESKKYDLFTSHNWYFEVTTTSIDKEKDMKVLGYSPYYYDSDKFKKAKVRLNYVLLKDNINTFIEEIKEFNRKYPNIEITAIKLLNINTKNNKIDNKYSKWIYDNAIPKDRREEIKEILDKNFKYKEGSFDTYSWLLDNNHEIYFSYKKEKYGLFDLVYYGNKFIDYNLEEVKISYLLPKVYFASKFNKKEVNGIISFENDFRSKLLCSKDKLNNYNYNSFIFDKYQYIGPFYNEKASTGNLTNTECEQVVNCENELIDRCDVFMAYLDEKQSPGTVTELVYASLKGKKIIVFYKPDKNNNYSISTDSWYPIVFSKKQLGNKNIDIIPVNSTNDIVDYLQKH